MKTRLAGIGLAIAALMVSSAAGAEQTQEVVVEASPIVKTPVSGTSSPAPAYFRVAMSSRVSYADLDLKKQADVATLEQRVKQAATEVCEALGRAYPKSGPETRECAEQAVKRAMPGIKKAIAAAK